MLLCGARPLTARRAVLLLLASLLGGCRTESLVPPTWVQSPFVQPGKLPDSHNLIVDRLIIYSDQALPKHHRLLQEVALMGGELLRELGLPPSDEPIYVYLFSSPERFEQFLRINHPDFVSRRALFVQGDTSLNVYAHWGDQLAEDLRHEVTHGYLHSVVPEIPLWLDEGLAECQEAPRGQTGFHSEHYALLDRKLREGWRPDLSRLESLYSAAEMTQLDYAESWAWAYFLLKTTPERRWLLSQYLLGLRQTGKSAPFLPRLQGTVQPMAPDEMLIGYLRTLGPRYAAALQQVERKAQ